MRNSFTLAFLAAGVFMLSAGNANAQARFLDGTDWLVNGMFEEDCPSASTVGCTYTEDPAQAFNAQIAGPALVPWADSGAIVVAVDPANALAFCNANGYMGGGTLFIDNEGTSGSMAPVTAKKVS